MSIFLNTTAPADSASTTTTMSSLQKPTTTTTTTPQQPIDLSRYFNKSASVAIPTTPSHPSSNAISPTRAPDLSAYFNKPTPEMPTTTTTTTNTPLNNTTASFLPPRLRSMQSSTQTSTPDQSGVLSTAGSEGTQGEGMGNVFPQQQPFFGNDCVSLQPSSKSPLIPSVDSFLTQQNGQSNGIQSGSMFNSAGVEGSKIMSQQQQQGLTPGSAPSQQPNQNPLQSFFNYSQAVQMTISAFQSVSTSSITLIQALLMFKHEICTLLFGSNNPTLNPHSLNHRAHAAAAPLTLFQTLITKPIAFLFRFVITAIDWFVRLFTANLCGIKGLFYPKTNHSSLNHLNQHLPYPYTTLNQSQLTNQMVTGLNSTAASITAGPIVANLPPHGAGMGRDQRSTALRSTASSSFFSFSNLLYYTTTALGLYFFYKQSPMWLQGLEKRYNLVSMADLKGSFWGVNAATPSSNLTSSLSPPSPFDYYDYKTPLIAEINHLATNTPIGAIRIDDIVTKLGRIQAVHGNIIDFAQIERKIKLRLLQHFNKVHPLMYNYYAQNPGIVIPNDVVGQLDDIVFPQPIQHDDDDDDVAQSNFKNSTLNTSNTNSTTTHNTTTPPAQFAALPSLFDHVDTSLCGYPVECDAIAQPSAQTSKQLATQPAAASVTTLAKKQPTTLPQVAPVVFESDGIIFSIDQLTGQVVTSRGPGTVQRQQQEQQRLRATGSKKCLVNNKRK